MPEISHIDAKSGDVLLLVGTMKGAFLVSSGAAEGLAPIMCVKALVLK
jgi:hypothetical protein